MHECKVMNDGDGNDRQDCTVSYCLNHEASRVSNDDVHACHERQVNISQN